MALYYFKDLTDNQEIAFTPGGTLESDDLVFYELPQEVFPGQMRLSVVDAPVENDGFADDLLLAFVSGPQAGKQIYLLDVTPGMLSNNDFGWDSSAFVRIGDNEADGEDSLTNDITGTSYADLLMGLGGNDSIQGYDGADYIDGGTGGDIMVGGAGNDTYVVDDANDVVNESTLSGGAGTDTAMVSADWTMAANVEKAVMTGGANQSLTGNTGANTITGNGVANIVHASGGNDSVSGLAGNDKLWGGAANDTVNGGVGDDSLWGDAGADSLVGGNGNDLFYWDTADTRADGGLGNDTLKVLGLGATLDLTGVAGSKVTGIEKIDITGSGNNTLELTVAEVKALSDTVDKLYILGNSGDVVSGSGWTFKETVSVGDQMYARFTQDGATLFVDTDMSAAVGTH